METGQRADATSRCTSTKFGTQGVALGYYEDEYAKVADKWKFASRRYFLDVIDTMVSLRKTSMV